MNKTNLSYVTRPHVSFLLALRTHAFPNLVFCIFVISSFLLSGCGSFRESERESADLHLRVGTSQLQTGAYPQALVSLLKAESLDPDNQYVQNNLGLAYFVREKYAAAERHFRRALELDSKYSDARNNLGRVLIEAGKYREAISVLDEVATDLTYVNPEKPLINLGMAYFKLKEYNRASSHLLKALEVQRDNCIANSFLGRVYFESKNYSKATEQLDKAVGFCLRAQYDEPHYYSALSYYQAGEKTKAVARLEEIIKLYPEGKYLDRAKSMLKMIRQ